jgi:4-hydroxyproline epimerase
MSAANGVPPGRHIFACIDGHTCGNPVRLVTGGGPLLNGNTMSEMRQDFMSRFDWVRRSLMFEPRGHDAMSGAILYPPLRPDCDIAILYIEVTGCLPICGHGTIGSVTFALEHGLVTPREEGIVALDAPAGRVTASFVRDGALIDSVRLYNVPSYLAAAEVAVAVEGLGELVVDIAYGGNFYAIVDPQPNYPGLDAVSIDWLLRWSPVVRRRVNEAIAVVHPDDPTIGGVSHVQWTGQSIVRRAAPEPRPGWRNSPRKAGSSPAIPSSMRALSARCSTAGWRARAGSARIRQSCPASPAGRGFTG